MSQMSAKLIIKNLFSLTMAEVISKAIGLITTAYLARAIQPEGFGIIGFASSFVAYFTLLVNLGFDALGTREIARDREVIRKYVNNIVTIRLILAVFGYATFLIVVMMIDKTSLIKTVLMVMGLGIFANAFLLNWVFQGIEKMEVIALRQILTSFLILIGVVLLVHDYNDVIWFVLVSVFASTINTVWMLKLYIRSFGKIKLSFDTVFWRWMLRAALPMAFSSFMTAIYYNLDIVMLGFLKTEHEVGLYNAAYKILLMGIIPANIICKAFFPQIARSLNDKAKMISLMKKYSVLMFIVGFFLASGGITFAKDMIVVIFGASYLESDLVLKILMVNLVFVYINITYGNPLLAWNKQKTYMYAISLGGVGNIILNMMLIPAYGMAGAAVATVLSEVIVLCGLSYLHYLTIKTLYLLNLVKIIGISAVSFGFASYMIQYNLNILLNLLLTGLLFAMLNFLFRTIQLREIKGHLRSNI